MIPKEYLPIYILCIYSAFKLFLRYPMDILWVSYGYPMVKDGSWPYNVRTRY